MKLNLGSARMQLAGYLSVDIDPTVEPDIVADVLSLPLEDDSVEMIWCDSLLQHLPRHTPLLEWYRVLEPGGTLWVTTPDVEQVYLLWKHGQGWGPYNIPVDEEYIDAIVFGSHRLTRVPELSTPNQTPHQSIYIRDMLVQALLRAGFCNVTEVVTSPVRQVGIGETMCLGYKPKEGE